jgi:hypothetical protein
MNDSNKYNHYQMQERLPDFVFDRLPADEKIIFNNSLPDFHDIEIEIENIRAVFSRVEKMNFDNLIEQKTRNLSVKVNRRLKQPIRARYTVFALRYIVPGLSLLLLALFMFNNSRIISNKELINADKMHILMPSDANSLIDSSVSADQVMEASASMPSMAVENSVRNLFNPEVSADENELSDALIDEIFPDGMNSGDIENTHVNQTDQDILPMINSLDDIEYQNILKEFENAKI